MEDGLARDALTGRPGSCRTHCLAGSVLLLALPLVSGAPSSQAQDHPRRAGEGRVEVTLVLLDAVVTDKKGNPVTGLGVEDFDLLVDNVRSPIEAVEDHCPVEPPDTLAPETLPAGAPPRHLILLFDMSHLKAPSRARSIKTALQFIDQRMSDSDRVMVLAFARGLYIVSGFTADRPLLRAKVEGLLNNHQLMDTAAFEEENDLERFFLAFGRRPGSSRPSSRRFYAGGTTLAPAECVAAARISEFETTKAVRTLANAMPALANIPGRKALFFFSETLKANPARPYYEACRLSLMEDPALGLTVNPEIRDLAEKANLAGVSFYTAHSGGLSEGATSAVIDESLAFQKSIALSTGGRSFVIMNQPLEVFDQATRDLSCYYVLAYRPPDGFGAGRHEVRVRLRREGLHVRHRESFVIQKSGEATEQEMLAVLSNPGLHRDLPVEAHGFSLLEAEGGRRRFLLQASVLLRDLTFTPMSGNARRGSAQLRGGVVTPEGHLQCEFSETLDLVRARPGDPDAAQAGVQTLCDLEPGDNEIVVAARDEVGGSLGTFWGKVTVKRGETLERSAALLWAPSREDVWVRRTDKSWLPAARTDAGEAPGDPFIVRSSRTLRAQEPGIVTFLACRVKPETKDTAAPPLGSASASFEGMNGTLTASARLLGSGSSRCVLLGADLPAGALRPGSYAVRISMPSEWTSLGSPVTIRVD